MLPKDPHWIQLIAPPGTILIKKIKLNKKGGKPKNCFLPKEEKCILPQSGSNPTQVVNFLIFYNSYKVLFQLLRLIFKWARTFNFAAIYSEMVKKSLCNCYVGAFLNLKWHPISSVLYIHSCAFTVHLSKDTVHFILKDLLCIFKAHFFLLKLPSSFSQ